MAYIATPTSFYGYPVPDCCSNSNEADRFFGHDLIEMSRSELELELSYLEHVLFMGKLNGVRRPPVVNTPDGNPKSFYVWARDRIDRIGHALKSRSA